MKLLVLYPQQFNCLSKLTRKLENITRKSKVEEIISNFDGNQLLDKYCQSKKIDFSISSDWKAKDFSHAVIFDDGEVFCDEYKFLIESDIPVKRLKVSITRVINIKKESKYQNVKKTHDYEYIGRGSYWGNPYSMFEGGDDREEVIRKYKYDFDFDKFPHINKDEVYKLVGKRLGCFCKPDSCHGDVLADFLNSWDDGE